MEQGAGSANGSAGKSPSPPRNGSLQFLIMNTLRIANAAGFWGDQLEAPRRTLAACRSGGVCLDYLTLEYLAELTMSILAHQRARDPALGYVTDFPRVLESILDELRDAPETRIVTNAGGANPLECARRAAQILVADRSGRRRIAAVTGDDLTASLDTLLHSGEALSHLDSGTPLGELRERVVSANAYLGAAGIVDALANAADMVITGRVADASLTVGPAMQAFGWKWNDWRVLAAATVAGHLIECGAQVTGGMYSGWTPDIDLEDVGYPIAEIAADGTATVTKPPGTGGAVTRETVAEQLIYEIGDPAAYLTPDVVADFREVTLTDKGPDRVGVAGARGTASPDRLKVSLCYTDGYAAAGTLVISGPDAVVKADVCGKIILDRLRRAGIELQDSHVERLGAGDAALPAHPRPSDFDPPEVVLRVSVRDPSRAAVERFTREFAPLVTSGPPGVSGYTGARPKPHPVLAYWPTTIARECVASVVTVKSASEWLA